MMDTSPEYIEMSLKAWSDLRNLWKFQEGDFLFNKENNSVIVLAEHDCCGGDYCGGPKWNTWDDDMESGYFPLLRQDQLQEMVGNLNGWDIVGIAHFLSYNKKWTDENLDKFETMEQLWLAFTMREKFNKVWDEKDWVENE